MPTFREPEDVDFLVGSGPADPAMARAVSEFIKAYRWRAELAEASMRAGAGADPGDEFDRGTALDHWTRVIEALDRGERRGLDDRAG